VEAGPSTYIMNEDAFRAMASLNRRKKASTYLQREEEEVHMEEICVRRGERNFPFNEASSSSFLPHLNKGNNGVSQKKRERETET